MTPTPQQLLTRAFWLAFQASRPAGLGFFDDAFANALTEEKLASAFAGDIADGRVYTDYVSGRMMKTAFTVKDGALCISPEVPRHDYQSWAGTYASATELIAAAEKSFN